MSREIRYVPADWQHPKNEAGQFIPLLGKSFVDAYLDFETGDREEAPNPDDYMPEFGIGTADYMMAYETTTEGTPLSPAFANDRDLVNWLVSNQVTLYAGVIGKREDWLAIIEGSRPVVSLDMEMDEFVSFMTRP